MNIQKLSSSELDINFLFLCVFFLSTVCTVLIGVDGKKNCIFFFVHCERSASEFMVTNAKKNNSFGCKKMDFLCCLKIFLPKFFLTISDEHCLPSSPFNAKLYQFSFLGYKKYYAQRSLLSTRGSCWFGFFFCLID